MASNQRDFRKDKPKPLRVRRVAASSEAWGWLAALYVKRDIQLQLV